MLEKIGAEVVYPERDMALRLAKKMLVSSVMDSITLDNNVEISEVMVPTRVIGKSLEETRFRQKTGLNIIAIQHKGITETEISPRYIFAEGDILVVIGKSENVSRYEGSLLA